MKKKFSSHYVIQNNKVSSKLIFQKENPYTAIRRISGCPSAAVADIVYNRVKNKSGVAVCGSNVFDERFGKKLAKSRMLMNIFNEFDLVSELYIIDLERRVREMRDFQNKCKKTKMKIRKTINSLYEKAEGE